MLSAGTIAIVIGTFLLGGFVKGALGLGMPIVALSVLAPLVGLKAALAIFILPSIISNLWQAFGGPDLPGLLRRLWTFLAGAALGIWVGTGILAAADTALLEALLGVLLILYAVIALLTPPIPGPGRHERWISPLAGSTGGVLCGATGIFIIPGILYLEALRLPREHFVQALGITFITLTGSLSVGMAGRGLIGPELLGLSALAVLPTLGGMALGRRVRGRLSDKGYRTLFFIGRIGVGIYMIARAP